MYWGIIHAKGQLVINESIQSIYTYIIQLQHNTAQQNCVDISLRKLYMVDILEYGGVFFIIHCCYHAPLPTISLAPGRCGDNCKITLRLMSQKRPLMISQYCFRQQAINWASVDTDLCHHMVSLGHTELSYSWVSLWYSQQNITLHTLWSLQV